MLKIILALLSLPLLASSAHAMAPTHLGSTGVGLQVGTLSAVTIRQTLSEQNAWDLALGTTQDEVIVTADYLWYVPDMMTLHPYVGLGAGIGYDTETVAAEDELVGLGRIPLGVSYYPANTSLHASFQLTPMFRTLGGNELAANIALLYHFQ